MELPALPIDRYRIRLRLTRPACLRFHHGAAVREVVARALGCDALPAGVVPAAPESGRTILAAGDAYELGLTLVGEERRRGERLEEALAAAGDGRPRYSTADAGAADRLAGGFAVDAIEPLPPIPLDTELAALSAADAITLELLTPLAAPRPTAGDGGRFPAEVFLAALWERLVRLFRGAHGDAGGGRRCTMPPLRGIAVRTGDLPRLSVAPHGRGLLGRVTLHALPPEWLGSLLLGRHLHAGDGSELALGRYRLLVAASPEPFRPSRELWPGGGGEAAANGRSGTAPPPSPELVAALDAWAEDAAPAHHPGLRRAGAADAERRAVADGLVWRRPADLAELLELVPREVVAERARAAFPLHRGAAQADEHLADPAWRTALARLALPEIAAALGPERRLARKGDGFVVFSDSRSAAPGRSDPAEREEEPTGPPSPPPAREGWPM